MKTILKVVIPLLIVAAAIGIARQLVASAETAKREVVPAPPPMVEYVEARQVSVPARVRGTGTVIAAREVRLAPQVGGRVVEQSDNLVLGGRFREGEMVVRIDARDYALAIRERRSHVEQARLELELEKGRGEVAQREWGLLGKQARGKSGALALRKPHLETAKVNLEAAESGLKRAKLDRGRATLVAPFDATVVAETVEIGQVVQPGASLATLVGTEEIWVRVSLPMADLDLIEFPGSNGAEASPVSVVQDFGDGKRSVHVGRVERLVGELDAQTRLAQVIVVVEDPFDPGPDQLPLLPGAFVTADIEGKAMSEVVEVPRVAIVEGDSVWVVNGSDQLERRELVIAWRDEGSVWARSGLQTGDRVVTTRVPAVAGMSVRPEARTAVESASEGSEQ